MSVQGVPGQTGFWARVGHGLVGTGLATGSWLADRYRSIDPEFRAHLGETPLLALTLLAPGQTPSYALDDDGQRLIVFVHGLGGHRGNLIPMQKYFGWLGRTRAVSIGFPSKDSIEAMAAHLRHALRRLISENPLPAGRGIDIVAHSMGGLISRLALQDEAIASQVHTLITLATPHQGTQLARYADTQKIKALRPDSKLIQELNDQLPWGRNPNLPRLICFWTPEDLILLPPQSAIAEGAEAVCVPGSSHNGFLLERPIWQQIFSHLEPVP